MGQTPDDLRRQIEDAQRFTASGAPVPSQKSGAATPAAQALRAATDLVAALFVGGFGGYWLDRWLGTKPWGMILLFFIGFAAGFLNIYRAHTGKTLNARMKDNRRKDDGAQST